MSTSLVLRFFHISLYFLSFIVKCVLFFSQRNSCNTSENAFDMTSDSCSDHGLEYFSPTKLSKIKVENMEEFFTNYMNEPSTECVDAPKSEYMDVPSSSTFGGEVDNLKATNEEHPPSSSIKILENSAKSIVSISITEELFRCLAKKVNEANLTQQQRNDIESSVCSLVYSKLANYSKD